MTTVLETRLPPDPNQPVELTLALTAEQRTRSRHRFTAETGESVYLNLPRGTVLRDGDRLQAQDGTQVRVVAKPETVLTVTASSPFELLRAAYHLGNRHIALELAQDYLRLLPDPVLEAMLEQLGLTVVRQQVPFEPEAGAYGHVHHDDH
ncbi:urease accessory protein UreE [Romeria aff. gracilis LEGE 07310]|uniref:Urease accessory protein UreE n=1 Tax=Vasconcelosia minhoensis LEGE 07310 TaxID=915328 RepID=A0A8J7AN09_9CYAN|nr:urease accessory protein UreE [Romeria gracilis]MBE9077499.1 urease accessory protein UreE [Romeria aff. gracilis LEGE 07310]